MTCVKTRAQEQNPSSRRLRNINIVQLCPRTNPRNTALIAQDQHLSIPLNQTPILGASSSTAPRAIQREQNLSRAIRMNGRTHTRDYTAHLRVLRQQHAFTRQQHLHEKRRDSRSRNKPTGNCQQQYHWHQHRMTTRQQIPHAAKPAQERHQREDIEPRDTASVCVTHVAMANMNMSKVQVPEPSCKRQHAEHKPHCETRQIDRLPVHRDLFAVLPTETALSLACECVFIAREASALTAPGRSRCSSRSASAGVSRIASRRTRHLRESSCLASASSARRSSGSRRNRSAPLTSQRSSLSSSVRASDKSSAW